MTAKRLTAALGFLTLLLLACSVTVPLPAPPSPPAVPGATGTVPGEAQATPTLVSIASPTPTVQAEVTSAPPAVATATAPPEATATATAAAEATATAAPSVAAAPGAEQFDGMYYVAPCRASGAIDVSGDGQCFLDLDDVGLLLAQAGVPREEAQAYADMIRLSDPQPAQVIDDAGEAHDGIQRRVMLYGMLETGRVVYVTEGLILVLRVQP